MSGLTVVAMRQGLRAFALALGVVVLLGHPAVAQQEEQKPGPGDGQQEQSLKWSEVLRVTKIESIPVAGLEGRAISLWQFKGLAMFGPSREVATTTAMGMSDNSDGLGPYYGYAHYRFGDGSTIVARLQGVVLADDGKGRNYQEGMLAFTQGTGRFTGILGRGSFTARQFRPVAEGGDTLVEVQATFTVPAPGEGGAG